MFFSWICTIMIHDMYDIVHRGISTSILSWFMQADSMTDHAA